jgi:signal transduction histidine kinase
MVTPGRWLRTTSEQMARAGVESPPMRAPPAGRLLTRLLIGTSVPTALVLCAFGVLAHEVARHVLEDELGRRLALAAAGAAGMILPEQLAALADSDSQSLTTSNVRRKLALARERFDVRRVTLVSRDLVARGDTDGRIPDGSEAHEFEADRLEMRAAAEGAPSTSPLFEGHDGLPYKRGYAAISTEIADRGNRSGNPMRTGVLGFVVVEASADYFVALRVFRRRLLLGGGAALLTTLLVTSLLARRISRPVVELAVAAERIGRGELDEPVTATTGDEVGFLARTLDAMRSALKARDERLQMMLAGIAHEVRNPLGGLELYAGLLRDALADQPERLEEIRRIDRELGYLKRVVNEFLDYARRPALAVTAVAVADLFKEVAELASTPQLRISAVATTGLGVRADEIQLRRALINLANNAVAAALKAHPAGGGQVELRAERLRAAMDGTSPIRIQIDDNGVGVAAELRERIFAPFFTTREKGTGLGLAFVKEIIADHGSEIRVGASPSGGARFEFELPAERSSS